MDIELIKKIVLLIAQIGTIVFSVWSLINLRRIRKKDSEVTKKMLSQIHVHEDRFS